MVPRGFMERRAFIAMLGCAAVGWPRAARAQQPSLPMVGFLNNGSAEAFAPHVAAFAQGLSEAGYVDGQNIIIDYRWAEGDNSRLPTLVADLVSRPAVLIAATGGVASALAAKAGTTTTPIVFAMGADPSGSVWSPISAVRAAISPASATSPTPSWKNRSRCCTSRFPG
jgi:putative tryptophan/tyrosine transport system substrate-binding protein